MKLEDIPTQRLLLNDIKSLEVDIDLIETAPEKASEVLNVPVLQLSRVHNNLKIQKSIFEFQHFFHHKI